MLVGSEDARHMEKGCEDTLPIHHCPHESWSAFITLEKCKDFLPHERQDMQKSF